MAGGTNTQLIQFLKLIEDNNVKFKRSHQEVADICKAVEEMLEHLLMKMGEKDRRFQNLRHNIIKVGSFYGGTKIKEPDEFDYLVVLDELPVEQVSLESTCQDFPGFRHVILKEGSELSDKWKDVTSAKNAIVNRGRPRAKRVSEVGDWHGERPKRTIRGEGWVEVEFGIRSLFYICLHKSFQEVKTSGNIRKDTGDLILTSYCESFIKEESMYHFKQQRTEIQLHGPATNVQVNWAPKYDPTKILDITVDISPAFRSRDIAGNIEMEQIQSESVRRALVQQGSFLIIPTSYQCQNKGLCFNVAHTESESTLTRNLSDVHKRCYKLLKFIMNGGQKNSCYKPTEPRKLEAYLFIYNNCGTQVFECFSSFVLKTVVIQHSQACQKCADLGQCVMAVLQDIRSEIVSKVEILRRSHEPINIMNLFDNRQRIMTQMISYDILTMYLRALDETLALLRQVIIYIFLRFALYFL